MADKRCNTQRFDFNTSNIQNRIKHYRALTNLKKVTPSHINAQSVVPGKLPGTSDKIVIIDG